MLKNKTEKRGRGRPKGSGSFGAVEYVRFTPPQSRYLDHLVESGMYVSRAEAMRAALARCMKLDRFSDEGAA